MLDEANGKPSGLDCEEVSSDDELEIRLRGDHEGDECDIVVSLGEFVLWCYELNNTVLSDRERIQTPYRIIQYVKPARYDSCFIRDADVLTLDAHVNVKEMKVRIDTGDSQY